MVNDRSSSLPVAVHKLVWSRALRSGRPSRFAVFGMLFRGGRVDDRTDPRDAVGWESAALRVLTNHVLARRAIDAIDLVVRHVAVNPLDLRPKVTQHAARGLRRSFEICGRCTTNTRHVSLYDELRHDCPVG